MCITAVAGALIGGIIGAASVAIPQIIAGEKVDTSAVGKAALTGAIVGAIGGLTFGAGMAAGGAIAGAMGITAASGTAATVAGAATVAVSGIAAGQASRATQNVLTGRDIGEGLFQPKDMLLDAALSLTFAGIATKGNFASLLPAGTPVHGNSLNSTRKAYLYDLVDNEGNHLKYGITQNPNARYTRAFMQDKQMFILNQGSRRAMYELESELIRNNPRGPLQLNNH